MKLAGPIEHARASWRRLGRRRRYLSSGPLAIVAAVFVVLAVIAEGSPNSDVDLNDGSVWVTNTNPEYQLLGRLNPQIRELDLGIQALSSDFDVVQHGSTVFLDIRSGGRALRQVDVAAGRAGDPIELSTSTVIGFGRDTVAMLDTETGKGWVRTVQTIRGLSQDEADPDVKVGRGGALTVGTNGTAWFVSSKQRTVTPVSIDQSGLPVIGAARTLATRLGDALQVSAVGDVPVILDRRSGTLIRPDADPLHVTSREPESVQLQQPGPPSDHVYVATSTGLLRAKLDGGGLEQVRGGLDGPPAAPVILRGNVHAAWSDPRTESYVRIDPSDDVHAEKIPGVTSGARLVFRTNRDVVVLNDIVNGDSWLVQIKGLPRVNNWDAIDPSKSRRTQPDPDPNKKAKANRKERNRPPKARDDKLGARPGQDTLLPVTRNDIDLDGDILTVASARDVKQTGGPTAQRIAIVGDGTQVQVRFGANDGGKAATFTYVTTDGRENGTDEGVVSVPIIPTGQNSPPEPVKDDGTPRRTSITLDRGKRSSLFVLNDWTDDDGDALILKGASIAKGGSVTFRPDGVLDFVDDGKSVGRKKIDIVVSDGRPGGDTKAQVDVNASAKRGTVPALLPDRTVGTAGSDILVEPLRNDASRDGTDLRLRDIVPPGGVEITTDVVDGTFVARTSRPGTYYLDYSAYTVRASANSFVRLDVLPKPKENLPPVASKDQGLIPPGGYALIDLLANDHDPEDGVLAVTSVQTPIGSGVKASLLQNRMLRVEAIRDLMQPVSIDYTVSDGQRDAQGSATVGQATQSPANRPPVAADDRVKVRAGAVTSVAVLDNDFDPDGDELGVLQSDITKPKSLPLYVQGDELRFRAPKKAGELRIAYGVRDQRGQRDDGELVIDVIADDRHENAAPRPKPVTARAIGSHPVRIGLGLQDADPDGDAVSIRSVESSPSLGRISEMGLDWIEYEGFSNKRGGTDSFEVQVQDRYGLTGVVQVKVCVVPQPQNNQPPTALADRIRVRPDRVIQYDVLANDTDPDGDALRLGLAGPARSNHGATAKGRFVTVQVPDVDGSSSRQVAIQYAISDGLGGADTARFTIDAADDAPLHAPITRDDFADPSKIAGRAPGEDVTIDALANDGDLDGRKSDLKLVAFDKAVSSVKGDKLRVTLKRNDQIVAYELHDSDNNTSYGFAFVHGTETVPPILNPKAVPLKVKAGRTLDVDLGDVVLVRRGRKPIVTAGDTVKSAPFPGAATATSKDHLKLTAPADYSGAAAITLEVTDGDSLNDPNGLSSYLTIPVDVIGAPARQHNEPPQARNVSIQLEEDKEKRFDLSASASDPNPDDAGRLRFSARSAKGISASISDATWLVLKAGKDVEDGTTAQVPFTVTDPKGASTQAVANVTVVKSDKPLVTVGRVGPIDAVAGKPVSIDINDHASNTFDESPLQVSSAALESGDGTASASGSSVTATPAVDFHGTLTAKFTVLDGSGDAEREVTGRMEVTVSARPSAPGRPSVSSTTASSATLTWSPSEDNGAPITAYEVQYAGGAKSCGTATVCEVTGLNPGTTYAFTVVATNKVGTSGPSAASEQVTPDKVPERMARPAISQDYTQRDKQLILSWAPPANEGSAIKTYEIHLLGTGETRQATASPFTWTGLTNGTSVQFEIRAVNDITFEQRKQQFSEPSGAETPFGVPADVGKPSAAASQDDGVAGGIVNVSWKAPADNGDAVDTYKVVMFKDGASSVTKQVTDTSERFNVDNGHDYTFTVAAHNRAGYGANASPASDKVNPYDKASAVQNLNKVSEADKQAVISFTAPTDDGGRDITGYRISSTGGPTKTVTATGNQTVSFSANNGPYTVTVAPITSVGTGASTTLEGTSANVSGVRPFGPPFAPVGGGASSGYRAVNFSGWSEPPPNGRPVLAVQHDNGGWQNGTSTAVGTDQGGEQRCINVRTVSEGATSSDRLTSAPRQICGTSQPRTVSVSFVPVSSTPDCSSNCKWVRIDVSGFRSSFGYTVTGEGDFAPFPRNFSTDGNGRATFGGGDRYWWNTGYCDPVVAWVDGVRGVGDPC